MRNPIRFCTLCDQPYQAGTYRAHRAVHVPVRRGPVTRKPTEAQLRAIELLSLGHRQSEVARLVGLTRQRVNQIAKAAA
jgi:hypothetical protein